MIKRYGVLLAASAIVFAMVVAGCSGAPRDVSTPRKALLGHWRNTIPGTNGDVYYSPTEVTRVSVGSKPGTAGSSPYSVVKENPVKFTLEISAGGAAPTGISFSSDRTTMSVAPARVPELLQYEYVDAKQKP
jgi:hypothetical protein